MMCWDHGWGRGDRLGMTLMVLVLPGVIIRLIVCSPIEAGAAGRKAGELVAPIRRHPG